jgi:hypothetical protein
MNSSATSKVSDIWVPNVDLLNSIFSSDFVRQVLQIPFAPRNGEDKLSWKPNKSGKWTAQRNKIPHVTAAIDHFSFFSV